MPIQHAADGEVDRQSRWSVHQGHSCALHPRLSSALSIQAACIDGSRIVEIPDTRAT
jgi:hypothetical protein